MSRDVMALKVLLKQAEAERDEALMLLREAEARATAAQQQAEQLQVYRGEYRQRWSQQFAQGGTIQIVQCYQSFSDRLEQAVQLQQNNAVQQQAQLDQARALLAQRELRVASVGKLIQRREQELRQVQMRQEQKTTDEAAQRSGWNSQLPHRLMNPIGG